jgi:hypothetical protein
MISYFPNHIMMRLFHDPAQHHEITNLRYFGKNTHFNWKNTVAQHENSSNLIIGQRFHDFARK